MKQYKNPKCKCGKSLMIFKKAKVETKIVKGLRAKKSYAEVVTNPSLKCTDRKCNRKYEYNFDDQGRYTRGDEL